MTISRTERFPQSWHLEGSFSVWAFDSIKNDAGRATEYWSESKRDEGVEVFARCWYSNASFQNLHKNPRGAP